MEQFATWLSTTPPSVFIQQQSGWLIPTIQSIHIVCIGIVLASVLVITLRILGLAGMDRTLAQTRRRFGPWLVAALWILLATGLVMILGEPAREFLAFSFWLKMGLVAVGVLIAWAFQRSVSRHEVLWEETLVRRGWVRLLAILTFLVWIAIIFLGRFIAYDHIWGALSPAAGA